MNKPTHKELHDDNDPATKGDVRRSQEELASMMASSFNHVATKADLKALATKDDLKALDGRMDRFEKTMATKDQLATVLNIVKSIDQKLTGLPEKVERLTKAVFPHR